VKEPLTIGVALTVPEPWGSMLQEQRAGYGDHVAWTIPTHITLLPPTQVTPDRALAVDEHLRHVAASHVRFAIGLRGTASFRPVTQTSFIVVADGAGQCTALADAVRTGPLRRRLPYPYHPHVTIAVDLPDEQHLQAESDLADFTLDFDAAEIERYELAEHGVWEPVASFPLTV
jgi:2'-5' RNA ligase